MLSAMPAGRSVGGATLHFLYCESLPKVMFALQKNVCKHGLDKRKFSVLRKSLARDFRITEKCRLAPPASRH